MAGSRISCRWGLQFAGAMPQFHGDEFTFGPRLWNTVDESQDLGA
jgi:hypothetical protein